MTADTRPILGISTGDPGGIGPEVTAKALDLQEIYDLCRPLAVGDARVMEGVLRFTGLDMTLNVVERPMDGLYQYGTMDIIHEGNMDPARLRYKRVTPEQGQASFEYVVRVINLALQGEIDGTVTGPINKASINAAGHHYAGHTEIYADLCGIRDYAMMLADGNFRVVHVSTHVSLREACDRVKKERIFQAIDLAYEALKKLGISSPRIGVAGLNPHCGEGGIFGREDEDEIRPAVALAVKSGKKVEGPIPADTVFPKMRGGQYDAVVVMYHDQGHIPIKLIGFQYDGKSGTWGAVAGINITLGLPIVRTSVDHGTAFGKAGEGRANPQSMIEAIRMAALLSRRS
jgi:4-hydroxythreonine-4-phosphate dehydrogenase